MWHVIIVGLRGCLKLTTFGTFMGNRRLPRQLPNVGPLMCKKPKIYMVIFVGCCTICAPCMKCTRTNGRMSNCATFGWRSEWWRQEVLQDDRWCRQTFIWRLPKIYHFLSHLSNPNLPWFWNEIQIFNSSNNWGLCGIFPGIQGTRQLEQSFGTSWSRNLLG